MKKTLVSILIPAYNAERWITETLESAISQTWQKKEIIVVDDGSSDKTFSIAKKHKISQGNNCNQTNNFVLLGKLSNFSK